MEETVTLITDYLIKLDQLDFYNFCDNYLGRGEILNQLSDYLHPDDYDEEIESMPISQVCSEYLEVEELLSIIEDKLFDDMRLGKLEDDMTVDAVESFVGEYL